MPLAYAAVALPACRHAAIISPLPYFHYFRLHDISPRHYFRHYAAMPPIIDIS
jgi:hypothetical protein